MNAKSYVGNADYSDCRTLSPATSKPTLPTDKAAGSYDKATFSKTQAPTDGTDFAHILACEAAGILKQGTSQGKIMELQQQIASGAYRPNARHVAKRILGRRQHIKGDQAPRNRFQFIPHLSTNSWRRQNS